MMMYFLYSLLKRNFWKMCEVRKVAANNGALRMNVRLQYHIILSITFSGLSVSGSVFIGSCIVLPVCCKRDWPMRELRFCCFAQKLADLRLEEKSEKKSYGSITVTQLTTYWKAYSTNLETLKYTKDFWLLKRLFKGCKARNPPYLGVNSCIKDLSLQFT